MKILSIGKILHHDRLDITSIEASSLPEHHDIELYEYIIINGGDGTIRRVLKQLHDLDHIPVFILNPTGSFNVVAKIHRAPKIEKVLDTLANGETPKIQKHHLFKLNDELFLFSAGNMGDLTAYLSFGNTAFRTPQTRCVQIYPGIYSPHSCPSHHDTFYANE